MSWNSTAREMSPWERAGSQHSEWRGDTPDPVGTVGSAASSSQLPSLLAAARGHGLPHSWWGHLELHAGWGYLQRGGRGQGCGCLQPGWNYSWQQHLLEHWTPSPPSSQHVGTRFPSLLPGYPVVSHTSTAALAGRGSQ